MRHEELGDLIDYIFWMRDRVLASAALLTESEFQSGQTVATRDLRATLAHQLENEWAWRIRLSDGVFPAGDVAPSDYPSLRALAARWNREERAFRDWFDGLSDKDLATPPPGDDDLVAMWRYLAYVVTHAIQQFTEAAILLTRLGRSPGEVGYLAFCTNRT